MSEKPVETLQVDRRHFKQVICGEFKREKPLTGKMG